MARTSIRDFRSEDLGRIVALWEETVPPQEEPVYGLSEVLASCQADVAVVAVGEDEEQLIGAAVGRAAHEQG